MDRADSAAESAQCFCLRGEARMNGEAPCAAIGAKMRILKISFTKSGPEFQENERLFRKRSSRIEQGDE
jgi:hypothetical protein